MKLDKFLDELGEKPEAERKRIYYVSVLVASILVVAIGIVNIRLGLESNNLGATTAKNLNNYKTSTVSWLKVSENGLANLVSIFQSLYPQSPAANPSPSSSPAPIQPHLPLSN